MRTTESPGHRAAHRSPGGQRHDDLTPEEDAVGDPDDVADEIDDTLPADLWF